MAYDLNGTDEDLVTGGTALSLSFPFTASMWVNADTIGQPEQTIFRCVDPTTGENNRIDWAPNGLGANPVRVKTDPVIGTTVTATSTGTAATGTWYMVTGVWASSTDRRAFFAATNKGTNTTNRTAAGTQVELGAFGSTSQFFNGRIAEVTIWNVALSDIEVGLLGSLVSVADFHRRVKPHNLVAHWSLHAGFLEEIYSGAHLTANNAPATAAHVKVRQFPQWLAGNHRRRKIFVGGPG